MADASEAMDALRTFDQSPFLRWVTGLMEQAHQLCASDLHFEPACNGSYELRLRIQGSFRYAGSVPPEFLGRVPLGLKLLGKMNITETRLPQDGQVCLLIADAATTARLSCVPTSDGEKFVLRLFDPHKSLGIEDLGIPADLLQQLIQILTYKKGLVLAVGPTNSGKTTTLYGILRYLSRYNKNIYTIEDPIEHILEKVHQIALRPEIGLTFSEVIRALLRQDPDVLMLGEIRDRMSAHYAVEAAQAGHLVLATLHAEMISSVPARLRGLGLRPQQFVPALLWIMGQRLLHLPPDHSKQSAVDENRSFPGQTLAIYEGVECTTALKTHLLSSIDPAHLDHYLNQAAVKRLYDHQAFQDFGARVDSDESLGACKC